MTSRKVCRVYHLHRRDKTARTIWNGVGAAKEDEMLWTLFVILLVLWLFGLVSSYTFGGFVHLLLVLAVIVLIINLVTGRRGAV
jgi:hypothetical protein